MSERGSFVTEYIYCGKCLAAAREVLNGQSKHFMCHQDLKAFDGTALPIIAGKVGGIYPGEELHDFEGTYAPALAKVVCHSVRVAVLAEKGERIFVITPGKFNYEE